MAIKTKKFGKVRVTTRTGKDRKYFNASKQAAEETQDEYQSTKVSRVTKGERYRSKPESKNIISATVAVGLATSAAVLNNLMLCVQGTSASTRIGNKLSVKSILSRISVSLKNDNAQGMNCIVRLLLVYDRQSNKASIDVPALLTTPGDIMSSINSAYAGRYRVIWDKVFSMVKGADSDTVLITENNRFKIGLPINYAANDGLLTDIERGNIALIGYYVAPGGPLTSAPEIDYNIKCSFKDT